MVRAKALARARPAASNSPRCATVCWTTLRPIRTERTNRQYVWALPSFTRVVWRKYISLAYARLDAGSQSPWSALHAQFGGRPSTSRGVIHQSPPNRGRVRSELRRLG